MKNIFPLGLLYVLGKENEIRSVCVYLRNALLSRAIGTHSTVFVSDDWTVMRYSGSLPAFFVSCSPCYSSASGSVALV